MKKLLSLLGAIAISASGATAVVSCSDSSYQSNITNSGNITDNSNLENSEINAGLLARARSIILSDQYKISEPIASELSMQQNAGNLIGDSSLNNETAQDAFSKWFNVTSLNTVQYSDHMSNISKNNIGDDGGILDYLVSVGVNKLIPDSIKKYADFIPGLSNLLNGDFTMGKTVADTISPFFSVIAKVNVGVAMTGIPVGLNMIPSIPGFPSFTKPIIQKIINSILQLLPQKTVTNFFDKLDNGADISEYASHGLSDISQDMANIINLFTNKNNTTMDTISNIIKLLNLSAGYLSFFDNDITKDIKTELSNGSKLSDSNTYKAGDQGKGFNFGEIINDLTYFLGTDTTTLDGVTKASYFAKLLMLNSDLKLNAMGTLISESIYNAFKTNSQFQSISIDDWNASFEAILSGNITPYLKSVFDGIKVPDNDYLNYLFTGDMTLLKQGIGDYVKYNLKDLFHGEGTDSNLIPNIGNLLAKVPLWKLLMISNVSGFTKEDIQKNNGLIPNYAGAYTQLSITQLANEFGSMFALNGNKDTKNISSIDYNFINFSKLEDLINQLVYGTKDNASVLSQLLVSLDNPQQMAQILGYGWDSNYKDANNKNGRVDYNKVKKQSVLGDLIQQFIPELEVQSSDDSSDDGYFDVTNDLNGKTDNLQFLFTGLSSFLGEIMKGTNYTQWLQDMLINSPNDTFKIISLTDKKYFSDNKLAKATFNIDFDPSGIVTTNGMKLTNSSSVYHYHITVQRDAEYDSFAFKNISRGLDI